MTHDAPPLTAYYRAVGKLADGHAHPTHTTDHLDENDAKQAGAALLESGVWTEFYVKTIHRRASAARR